MSIQQSTPQPGPGGGKPPGTPIIADVYARPGSSGEVNFSLEWRFEGDGSPSNGPIDVPAKKPGESGTPIQFKLHDETDRKLEFDSGGPFWVSRTTCPNHPESDPEIPTDQIKGNPNLLKIFDSNEEKCDLKYALVFRDRDGRKELYDPMIRNGGTI